MAANVMFGKALISISTHHRAIPAHLFSEIIATLGLLLGLQRRASGGILGPILTHCTWSMAMLLLLPPVFAAAG